MTAAGLAVPGRLEPLGFVKDDHQRGAQPVRQPARQRPAARDQFGLGLEQPVEVGHEGHDFVGVSLGHALGAAGAHVADVAGESSQGPQDEAQLQRAADEQQGREPGEG